MKTIAVMNEKGGVGKTTTALNFGVDLANKKNKVLLIDSDPQGSLSTSLGFELNELNATLSDLYFNAKKSKPIAFDEMIVNSEGVDLIPSNAELSAIEAYLTSASKKTLANALSPIKDKYDYIIIDCPSNIGNLTLNALSFADSVIVPVIPHPLAIEGANKINNSIGFVRENNPDLKIEGILITMADFRTKLPQETRDVLEKNFGEDVRIFKTMIPYSTRATRASGQGTSILKHDPRGPVAEAYKRFTKEVMNNGRSKEKGNIIPVR